MTASKIEWTGRSDWNPVRGCTRASEGCRHCYAEQIAGRFSDPGQPFHGFATRTSAGGRWTGKVELVEDRLTLPLRWRKPATIFASSTSDIFHESLSDTDIDRIFAVMALTPHHTYQVLTKRAERMRVYLTRLNKQWEDAGDPFDDRMGTLLVALSGSPCAIGAWEEQFVLPNVWLGVSTEDQRTANERIPHLMATPAAVRFLSCEPLIGPIDLAEAWYKPCPNALDGLMIDPSTGAYECCSRCDWTGVGDEVGIDWVIVGGESGRDARPMHPDWARALRDQCAEAQVPFFFKQWGSCLPGNLDGEDEHGNAAYEIDEEHSEADYDDLGRGRLVVADGAEFIRFSHKRTGRLLDRRHHDGVPA